MFQLVQLVLDLFGTGPGTVKVPDLLVPQRAPPQRRTVVAEPVAQLPLAKTESVADIMVPTSFRHPRANRESRLGQALVAYE